MSGLLRDYAIQKELANCEVRSKPLTMREKLEARKQRLNTDLELVNLALAELDKNPNLDKALEALSRVQDLI